MKTLVSAVLALSLAFGVAHATEPKKEAEVKNVCIDKITKDGKPVLDKAGKPVQECRKMKVHKKLEGTEVPPAKK
jgi:hypothetical protein